MQVLTHFFSAVLTLEMTAGEASSKDSDYEGEDAALSRSSDQSEQSPNGDSDSKSKGSIKKVRSEARWPADKITVTEINGEGMPIPRKERQRMRLLAGLIARQKVSLLHNKFADLGKCGKLALFDDYVMPYLHFNDDIKEKGMKRAMKAIAKCWRSFKTTLVSEYVLKDRSPFQCYKHLNKEEYNEFVKLKKTDEFQRTREKYRELRAKNKHPHKLGTGGYEGKLQTWEEEDKRLENEGLPNPWHQFPTTRAMHWLRARGTLTDSGEISFNSQATKEVAERIKQLSDEDDCSVHGNDVLTKALGNDEHPG